MGASVGTLRKRVGEEVRAISGGCSTVSVLLRLSSVSASLDCFESDRERLGLAPPVMSSAGPVAIDSCGFSLSLAWFFPSVPTRGPKIDVTSAAGVDDVDDDCDSTPAGAVDTVVVDEGRSAGVLLDSLKAIQYLNTRSHIS
jgi:hypothetical protein